ncbi:MAG: ATP-binding protein [Cytophaga sp.]|nr:ATP-binding protein [Cytophaga sp.]
MKPKAIFHWSGGKDSSLSLYKVLQQQDYEVMSLLTSVSEQYQRISMHGVRTALLHQQAERIGIPLQKMQVPDMPSMDAYDAAIFTTLSDWKLRGAEAAIYGDIFLEDLRKYREDKLAEVDLKPVFPLWKRSTTDLIREFIDLGFKAILVCVSEKQLDKSFVGRIIDHDFVKDLPADVDPCGENGEYHTFVFDGPIFQQPVPFTKGEIVYRRYDSTEAKEGSPFNNGFWFCDLIPSETTV